MEKPCKNIEDMLVDYADGGLSRSDASKVAEHLARCEDCRTLLDGLRKSLELTGVIWADGNHHEHWLNDQKVVDYVVGSDEWETRFQRSKFYNDCGGNRDMYGKHPSGHFGLQAHGAGLFAWFKNLKVRPFTPGEQLVTPTLTVDEEQQTATVSMEVAITGASIHYTLDGSEPDENSPVYTEPLELSEQTVIKAVTAREDFQTSEAGPRGRPSGAVEPSATTVGVCSTLTMWTVLQNLPFVSNLHNACSAKCSRPQTRWKT